MKRKATSDIEIESKRVKISNFQNALNFQPIELHFMQPNLFDEDWFKLGGFPDYRPYAQRNITPMPIMLREETNNTGVNEILRLSLKRKKTNQEQKISKRTKLEELSRLTQAIKKEKAMNREIEQNLRQKLKT